MTGYILTERSAGYKIENLLSYLQNLDLDLAATSFSLGFKEAQLSKLLFCQDVLNYRIGLGQTSSNKPSVKIQGLYSNRKKRGGKKKGKPSNLMFGKTIKPFLHSLFNLTVLT